MTERTILDQALEALRPFANYVPKPGSNLDRAIPDDLPITVGSPIARMQLTMGDCRRAAAAVEAIEKMKGMLMQVADWLPCPFCGSVCDGPQNFGDARDYSPQHARFIECRNSDCHASMWRMRSTIEDADTALIEAWNRRVEKMKEAEAIAQTMFGPVPQRMLDATKAENDALLEAERLLESHGYVVTFDHGNSATATMPKSPS